MKKIAVTLIVLVCGVVANAGWYEETLPQKDAWGNSYKINSNLDKDSDGDGISNRYDYNDRNPRIQRRGDVDYGYPGDNKRNKYPCQW